MSTKESTFKEKDRVYYEKKPSTSLVLQTRHKQKSPLQYKEAGKPPRSIRYATNQDSLFMEEQEGDIILGQVVFIDGKLTVSKDDVKVQKLLSIYHPHKDILYYEFDAVEKANKELANAEQEWKAKEIIFKGKDEDIIALSRGLNIRTRDKNIAELKSELLGEEPNIIIKLHNDEDLPLLSLAYSAIEENVVKVVGDKVVDQKGNVICSVPFDVKPHEVLTNFLKTKDGLLLEKFIKKSLND